MHLSCSSYCEEHESEKVSISNANNQVEGNNKYLSTGIHLKKQERSDNGRVSESSNTSLHPKLQPKRTCWSLQSWVQHAAVWIWSPLYPFIGPPHSWCRTESTRPGNTPAQRWWTKSIAIQVNENGEQRRPIGVCLSRQKSYQLCFSCC